MKPLINGLAVALVAAGISGAAVAQSHHGHGAPAAASPTAQTDSPSTKAFRDVGAVMHRDMDIRYTNDADVDFVRGMIPHHQGAIDMAEVALKYAKDPEIRKLAGTIIADQKKEIAQMKGWLEKMDKTKR